MAKGEIKYSDNFIEVKRRADNLRSSIRQVKKNVEELNSMKSSDGVFTGAFKGITQANKQIASIRQSQEGLNKSSQTYQRLEKQVNQYINQRRQLYKGLNESAQLLITSGSKQAEHEGKILKTLINHSKEQEKINRGLAARERYETRIAEINKQNTAEAKRQTQELNQVHKKAQEVGQLTKSLLQDKGLNSKGAKNTTAQWDYQIAAIKKLIGEIQQADNSAEGLEHTLESMVYEVKHVTGKSLFKDTTDGINKLINLENKRYEAQKSGKQIMEDYYNSEIQKQKELVNNLEKTATDPQKLQALLKDNMSYIKNLLPEDMQAKFEEQFNKTGLIDKAWAEGMKQYVDELRKAYNDQVKLNEAKSQQNTQDNAYKSLKADLQEIYNLENRLTELQKDPKKHINELQYTKELLNEKKSQLNLEQRISELSPEQAKDIKNATKAQGELNAKIKAQGKDWQNNNQKVAELGDTIKKVFNYVLVYRGFQMLTEGIQKALDTMKELDKAFTDIQMVTGDSKEQTAQLAQDYNKLAKEMGATTQEVAKGASEWFNESRDHLKTLELLETRED